MRIKNWYFVVIFGIGLMLINILLNTRVNKTAAVVNKKVENAQTNIVTENIEVPAFAQKAAGITILGIRQVDKRPVQEKDKDTLADNQRLKSTFTHGATSVPGNPVQEEGRPVSAGITKDEGKRPTPKEQEEMNAKGIIIF